MSHRSKALKKAIGNSEQELQHECIDRMPTWNRNRNCNRNVLIAFQLGTGTGTGTAQNKQLKIIRNNSIKQFMNNSSTETK